MYCIHCFYSFLKWCFSSVLMMVEYSGWEEKHIITALHFTCYISVITFEFIRLKISTPPCDMLLHMWYMRWIHICFLNQAGNIWCIGVWKKKSTQSGLWAADMPHEQSDQSVFACVLPPPLCLLSLPVLLHCDSESDSPSSLRIECSFMIVPPLSNQLNRLLLKLSEITCARTVKIKTAEGTVKRL